MQTLSGFGFALVVMPLMTLVLGFKTTAPLVALIGLPLYAINLVRYGTSINKIEVLRLSIASALGIPIGIFALSQLEEPIVKLLLGLILIAYAVYAFIGPDLPHLKAQFWVYIAGFIAGLLGGAYNVPGPPAVVYGHLRQWSKDEFRAILQALFLASGIIIVVSHYLAQNLTDRVFSLYPLLLPALILGIFAGARLDHKLSYKHFNSIVKVLLFGLGLSLTLGIGSS